MSDLARYNGKVVNPTKEKQKLQDYISTFHRSFLAERISIAVRIAALWNINEGKLWRADGLVSMKELCEKHNFSHAYAKHLVSKGNRIADAIKAVSGKRPVEIKLNEVKEYIKILDQKRLLPGPPESGQEVPEDGDALDVVPCMDRDSVNYDEVKSEFMLRTRKPPKPPKTPEEAVAEGKRGNSTWAIDNLSAFAKDLRQKYWSAGFGDKADRESALYYLYVLEYFLTTERKQDSSYAIEMMKLTFADYDQAHQLNEEGKLQNHSHPEAVYALKKIMARNGKK
ncbi:MAG: hypothetical protein M5R41_10445 [Bacteroidia bacterium]|nr:hypothetical protein [Bacteroidia bacterium]